MRSVCGQVAEERLLALDGFDPAQGLPEEDVGAVAPGLLELAVMQEDRVEVGVARSVTAAARITLADAAAAVDEHLIEAAFVRPVIGLITKVPFAEDAGGVSGRL